MWKQKSAQMLSAEFDPDFPRDLAMHKHSQNLNSTTCLLVLVHQKPLMQTDKECFFPHTIPDQSVAVQGVHLQIEHAAEHVFFHS